MSQFEIGEEEIVFGLDIGTRNVVGTLGYRQDEKFIVIAQEIRKHKTRAMLDGQIHDISRVASTIKEIKQALEEKTGYKLKKVCIAAAGRVLKTMNVHADYKFEQEQTVGKDDLDKLISIGVEKAFDEFQANNETDTHFYCVGYSVVRYYINDVWISQPEHHKARKLSGDIIATFLPDDVVDGLYSAVELADLTVGGLTLEPIAAIRVAIPEKFRLLNIAMIDVGAGTSDISITNEGSVIAFGMIPCAGDSITEAIAKGCLIDFSTAEKIKTSIAGQDEIIYEDIMGLEQSITPGEVIEMCQPQIDKMAHLASEEIKKLNGGSSPSAVFVVGGGGKIKGFTAKIAEELGLDPKRVALRGQEIMKDIEFPPDALKDSTIITPIGICLTYYDQNNNFIYVTFNGKKLKMYDNNKLTVMDAAIQAAFSRDGLFAKKGEDLKYTINGKRHTIRGEFGESAQIYVNDEPVTFNHPIRSNDKITIEAATVGKTANVKLFGIEGFNETVTYNVNGDDISLPVLAKVNDKFEKGDYQIKSGDKVELPCNYTLEMVMDYMKITPFNIIMTVNGNVVDLDYELEPNDVIELNDGSVSNSESKPSHQEEDGGDKLLVIVNDKPVVMKGKASYTFVDVFNYIDFDTTRMQGNGIATIVNGQDAIYTQPLHAGDKIDIYWK